MDKEKLNFQLATAISLASEAHEGQYRFNGDPYIFHPIRVMLRMTTIEEKIVAILHDVVEDTRHTLTTINETIEDLDPGILFGIRQITKCRKGGPQSYGQYLSSILESRLAMKVKLADLEDNMNMLELPDITERRLEKLEEYHSAYKFLQCSLEGMK